MPKFNKKTQMIFAGSALFSVEGGFGYAIGSVKNVLSKFGKLYEVSDDGGRFSTTVNLNDLPDSTEEADFFVDCSSIWRICYISCTVEESNGRYIACFKEGNRSTIARTILLLLSACLFLTAGIFAVGGLIGILVGGALFLWMIRLLISPSDAQTLRIEKIKNQLKSKNS